MTEEGNNSSTLHKIVLVEWLKFGGSNSEPLG
jgi:hypothetical protein